MACVTNSRCLWDVGCGCQADVFLDEDGALYTHVKVSNPGKADIAGYWWMNVGM